MAGYLTIQSPSSATVREKMSRFLAFAHPVADAGEARSVIADYTNRYHDARHVCWAYMVGADRATYLSSDNGEPSGTAGKPILGQINSFGLTNVVIIVVRYFGGIKLGTSGLIAAYREAARQALEAAEIVEAQEMTSVILTYPYQAMEQVMRTVKRPEISIISQDFNNTCALTISLPLSLFPEIAGRLSSCAGISEAQSSC